MPTPFKVKKIAGGKFIKVPVASPSVLWGDTTATLAPEWVTQTTSAAPEPLIFGHYVMGTSVNPFTDAPVEQTLPMANIPRTQKSKGLLALLGVYPHHVTPVVRVLQKPEDLTSVINFPYFARPAPFEAKHGYIDSRIVHNRAECHALLMEVLADDPQGEVILCKFVKDTHYNMVWTPTSLTIGKGHDGATAGKHAVVIPLAGAIQDDLRAILKAAGIGPGQRKARPNRH